MSKRLAKLYKPCDQLDRYDNEEYTKNPLLHFHICEIKERRHYTFLKKKAADQKIKLCRTVQKNLEDLEPPLPEKAYIRKLHKYADNTPIPKMLNKTEQKMINYVPKRLRDLYPNIVHDYMSDVHKEFDKIIKAYSLQKLLKPNKDDYIPPRDKFAFQRLGKTKNFTNYLYNRERIKKRLMIFYPFVRCVLHYANLEFPIYLNDYSLYRLQGETTLNDLENQVTKDLNSNSLFIKKNWYQKIINILKKHYKKRTIARNLFPFVINCVSGLIKRQIMEVKIRTINHLNDIIMNKEKIPYLKINAICDNIVDLHPSYDKIKKTFHNMIDEISMICSPLQPLGEQIDTILTTNTNIVLNTNIPSVYLNELHERLEITLNITYKPVVIYLKTIQDEYCGLYGEEMKINLHKFLNETKTFEEYLEKVDEFKDYIEKLKCLVQNVFFDMVTINQYSAIGSLRLIASKYIDNITLNIVKSHQREDEEICNIFKEIKRKALEIPKLTEQLLEGGDYMLNVKTVQMHELQGRIQESLRVGGLLIELTDLPEKHLNLQLATINWFHSMKDVFEQNASLFEQYKCMFEEKLQEVTKKLNEDISDMLPNLTIIDDMCDTDRFREYSLILQNIIDKLYVFDKYVAWINKEEILFKFPKSQYLILDAIKGHIIPFASLMKMCIRWLRYYYVWMDGTFEYLEPNFVETTTDEYYKEFLKLQKNYRNQIKADLVGSPILKFRGQTEDPDPEKHPVPLRLCGMMIQRIKDFRMGVYLVTIVCNPALCERHWDEMSEIAGFDLTPNAGTTLRKIINFKLDSDLDKFEIISVGANKELQLQQNLVHMIKEWETIKFNTSPYKNTDFTVLSSLDDIQTLLDDHIIKTLSMRGSAFVKPSEVDVKLWYEKITRVNKTLEEWTTVQSNWLYLLPIFSSKDIVAQMPEEGRLFSQVDSTYRRYMQMVMKEPLVMETAPSSGLLEAMETANIMLEEITNGVNAYLEKKRLYFPRFFFLSNDEMLEILSETKDPLRVQPHLSKCFEGIDRLEFTSTMDILSMMSSEKEKLYFVTKISTADARGSVEKWLLRVEEEMLRAVINEVGLSYASYLETKRCDWVLKWSQMVILCVSQIFWAIEVHEALESKKQTLILHFFEQLKSNLNDIVGVIRSREISNLNRITIKSLIVIDVHAKDVVEELIENKIHSVADFQWLAQLRYYFVDGKVLVKIINATVLYADEYLGNSDRLVITPLTDRCYRTLVGAYQLHLNGAPEGPAGTGKTETTKDLAKALAVQCKVFNCSDGLDYKAMGKFFKGLASSGAWACFDEFNRIELEVLSVVAQQILCIVQAVRANVKKFNFEGTELQLNPACYVCITMNPGYAGRSELPDNLKVLFRTVAMMVPDYGMIGEISLYSFGFVNARTLAVKIVTTYRLCSEQLSSQNHYDYGMRAVKTVLQACGNIKKAFPDENEDILLLRSLVDVNLPKFLSFDIPLFEGIISDLFPGITLPDPDYKALTDAFNSICEELNLQPKECFLTKVIQTYEMIIVRHGFMMVGESFAGKSTTLKVLAKVLSKLKMIEVSPYYQNVQFGIVNPKSITMGQLYGAFDPVSYEWSDGIAAKLFRNFATDTSEDRKWLIFDGPVDAVWIENMNTVLDDNKKLCLTSGEVVTMNNQMSMIFEVMDLTQASPATVSRCGMIFMEPVTLGWETFAKSWLNQCNPLWKDNNIELIMDLLDWIIPCTIQFIRRHCVQLLIPGDINIIRCTLRIFEILMNEACASNPDDYMKHLLSWFQATLIYSVVWGIAGILDTDSREKFDIFYRDVWKGVDPDFPIPKCLGACDISLPADGLLFDYFYIFKQKGAWKYWPELVRRMEMEDGPLGIQVPTIDTARYMQIVELHIKNKIPILLVGSTGTGKSFYTQNILMNKLSDEFVPAFITFTVMITANQTQDLVMTKLVKRKRGVYGPPVNKTCVIFVDDMNMPIKEIYGAQPPIELLRQYFDYKFWYDVRDTSKIFLQDLLIIAACGLVGGSRQDVYSRFLSHFNIFSINPFSEDTMFKIFTTVLLTGLKKVGHGSDVINPVNQIVSATLNIYNSAGVFLRPTPAKSHYIFNMRDISRVVMGCSLLRKESVENKKIFAKIWTHETMRVFYDRLIDKTDRDWFYNKLNNILKEFFKERIEIVFEEYVNENGIVTLESLNNLMFGTYMDTDSESDDRKYEEIPGIEKFREIAYSNLEEYNSTHKTKMDIVLFTYALQHLNKICRIMVMPAGSSLLVGMGGSGRQSSTRLAAAINGQNLFQPEITKNYGVNEWHDDLKKVLRESGGLGKDTVFLFTEGQIKMESFLQDIDCLLNLGEVPNIFAIDEKQEVLELVRLAAQGGNRNIDISPLQVFSFFVNRCYKKLHIILCLSPVGSAFRTRIRLYPSLVNCCTIDWFESWPETALEMVAEKYLSNLDVPENVKESVVLACKHFHVIARTTSNEFYSDTGRMTYVTSASYLELIKSFTNLTRKKQEEIMEAKQRYIGGLETLQKAAEAVAIMQRDLNAMQPQLIIMAENTREMAKQIEAKTIEASIATEQVKKDEIVANAQAASAQELKDECEKDLAQAIPVLEEAIGALNTLKPTDITLVKSMKNPPEVVKLVMAAVCVMKGVPPDRINDPATGKKITDFWGPSKKLLSDMGFLQALKDFDKDYINPEIMKKIRKDYIPHPNFKSHIVAKASSAAEGLCKWIIAMDLYDAVAKIVAPKRARLEMAEKEYADTMRILGEKRAMAEALAKKVAALKEALVLANNERQKVEDEVENCKNKLMRAETLIGGLGGERSRWTNAADGLQGLYDNLAGDILLSCGVIAYLAPFTMSYRNTCVDGWHKYCQDLQIPCSENFSFVDTLGTGIKVQNWNLAGLPRDTFSAENAIIMDNSNRYSLFIDPQAQASKWIKTMEKSNRLQILKFSQSDYMKRLETCIEFGNPALIEGIREDVEAPLDPLLSKNTFKQAGVEYITLGDNVIAMSPKFRLYMTSSLRNPHYSPEVFNKVTVINFALTLYGLEDQLLGIVVAKERPDLEELRQNLIIESAKNRTMLKDVEDNILKTLSSCKGDILEDESAIHILDMSKILSVDIQKKQAASKETEIQIESFRQSYKSVASHSSTLYYCITDLPNIDPMYQFSLAWYINLYIFSIENSNKSKVLLRRLKFLMDAVTYNLYCNICRSLFEKDKLLFSFILTTKIMLSCNQIQNIQFVFLLTGGNELQTTIEHNHGHEWITDKMWDDINRLEQIHELKGFVNAFLTDVIKWKIFYDHTEPHLETMPEPWEESLSKFEKLIIIHAIRPDKITAAITEFVSSEMGVLYVTPPPFDIAKSYEDANCLMPLIFILSPGADPMGSLLLFAEKMGFDESFQSISLGQGQGPIAQTIIENAQNIGSWVCLQNCHLAASWMPTLEYLWENMDIYNTAPMFRLWLTSYPSDKFPSSLLQNGVKMTNEPPTGLQSNLMRSYNSEPMNDEQFYTGCPKKDRAFTKLLYGICFFHAVVQERKKFGSLGWNILYGFNESDFQISVKQLQMLLNQYDEIPYIAITYLTGECNYGGRVTDTWDRRAIVTILNDYVNLNVVDDPSYKFSDISNIYKVPIKTEHREIMKYIDENIPNLPAPEVYGLHSNAGITRDLFASNLLLDSMILTLGKVSIGSDLEAEIALLTAVAEIENKLPPDFNIEIANEKYPVDYNESMNTVLVQEMQRFNKLLIDIRWTCMELVKAIKGIVVMTPELEMISIAITFKKIPARWMDKSYPSLKPIGSYIQDFVDRLKWLQTWYDVGKPSTFWVSGFFFTQAFLTGAMQNFARKYRIPIDTLGFDFDVFKEKTLENPPEDGVYINGLFVEGARWNIDHTCLEEQFPKVLIDVIPLIHLIPLPSLRLIEGTRYKCPLYKTAERKGTLSTTGHSTNYVLPILLDTKKPASHWIKRSVALICQTSD